MTFLSKIFGKGKLSSKDFWLMTLIPMGQLYARVERLDGSLDKEWTLFPLFMIPPLQIIPMVMINRGMIKKGKGGKPYDWYMIIPLIVKLLIGIISISSISKISEFIMLFIAVLIPFVIRSVKLCNGFDFDGFTNSAALTSYIIAITNIFYWVIGFVPLIGIGATFVKLIPIIGPFIIWALGYIPGYVVANMFDNKDPKAKCNKFKYKILHVVIATVVAVASSMLV